MKKNIGQPQIYNSMKLQICHFIFK